MLDTKTPQRLIVVLGGTGDTGRRLASTLADPGHRIVLTTRDASDVGWTPQDPNVAFEEWVPADESFLALLTRVRARFDRTPDVVINLIGAWLVGARQALVDITRDVVGNLPSTARYVHCSAVSVWGSRPGETVDESSPTFAEQRVARLHLEAEEAIDEAREAGLETVILRLPHIYGPGRERTVGLMRNGKFVILGDGRNAMHHLHVDDFVSVLRNVATRPTIPSPIYAVVDDDHGRYGDYCDFVTAATGALPLPFMSLSAALEGDLVAVLGPHFGSREVVEEFWRFMTSHLRIDNSKMKNELGIELRYPTYREGLPGVLDADSSIQIPYREGNVIENEWRVWAKVLDERPELTREEEPNELLHAVATDGTDASMDVSAWSSAQLRWGRIALLQSSRMDNVNVIFFPRTDIDAPILGLELAFNADGHSFSAFDLVGTSDPGWTALLDGASNTPGLNGKTIPVEGRLAGLLTPAAVVLRGAEVDAGAVLEAARTVLIAYLEKLSDAPGRPAIEGEAGQKAYCEKLLRRPGGADLLASLFGGEWSERFLREVYYPTP